MEQIIHQTHLEISIITGKPCPLITEYQTIREINSNEEGNAEE
jgi:hypothetical protein